MKSISVRALLQFSPTDPTIVPMDISVERVAEKMVEDHRTREVYVVDENTHFLGIITLRRLAQCVFASEIPSKLSATTLLDLVSAETAGDLVLRKPAYVCEEDTFEHLLGVMFRYDINEIPVVNDDKSIVGNINMIEILCAWREGRLDELRTA